MRKKKTGGRGGLRNGAGAPKTGVSKKKICISVDWMIWYYALSNWRGNKSRLVESLLSDFVEKCMKQETGAT